MIFERIMTCRISRDVDKTTKNGDLTEHTTRKEDHYGKEGKN